MMSCCCDKSSGGGTNSPVFYLDETETSSCAIHNRATSQQRQLASSPQQQVPQQQSAETTVQDYVRHRDSKTTKFSTNRQQPTVMTYSNTSYFGLNKLAGGSRRRKKNAPQPLTSQAMGVSVVGATVEVTTDSDGGGGSGFDGGNSNGGGSDFGGGNGNGGGSDSVFGGGNGNGGGSDVGSDGGVGGGGGGGSGTGAGGTPPLAVIKMTIKNRNADKSNGGGKDGDNDGGIDGGNKGGNGDVINGGNINNGHGRIAVKFLRINSLEEEPAIQVDTSVETEERSCPDGVQQVRGGVMEKEDENGCCVKTLAFSMEACGCSII